MATVLVVGFGPFLDVVDNPAAALARAVDGRALGGDDRVVGRAMDVSYRRAPAQVQAWVEELGADLVLGVGVARGRSVAMLERVAVRAGDASSADVDGDHLGDLGPLVDGGDARVRATFPEAPFLAATGLATSEDAGRYVCNAWLWTCAQRLAGVPVGFLHVPDVGLDAEVLVRGLVAVCAARRGEGFPAPAELGVLPVRVRELLEAIAVAGGRPRVVGGSVRDRLLGRAGKDLDLEVHRLELQPLLEVLRRFGRVDEVGRSFGVLKLRLGAVELDISIPRRDSRAGVGHKGIRADADPFLGEVEAARRRDLTVNAIAWDPLNNVLIDPFGGVGDLRQGLLRAVDARTFGEDPLRALRVAQFAGRLGAEVDPTLARLCAAAPLHELPPERVRGEIDKLLLKAARPSVGWEVARATGAFAKVLPAWDHPVRPELDLAASADVDGQGERLALLYAAASEDEAALLDTLTRLRVFRQDGMDVRGLACFLARRRDEASGDVSDPRIRRLADEGSLVLLSVAARNPSLEVRAAALGVRDGPLPALVGGSDALAAGFAPGPAMGEALARVREAQLEGAVVTSEDARALLSTLAHPASGGA